MVSAMVPGFVAIGAAVCAIIMLGLWANDGNIKGAFNGGLTRCSNSQDGPTVCAFLSSYPIAIAGAGMAIIGAAFAMISGFAMHGENGCFRVGGFLWLLFGAILSLAAAGILLGTYNQILGFGFLNAYGRAMLAFAFLTMGTCIATGILTLLARD